jgi:hypothetical protein
MKLAPSTGILILATAITLLSFLCSFAIIVGSAYAAQSGSGLSKAEENTCGRDHEIACQQICGFIRCAGLEVKNGDDLLHS